jgi:hypothetical protein
MRYTFTPSGLATDLSDNLHRPGCVTSKRESKMKAYNEWICTGEEVSAPDFTGKRLIKKGERAGEDWESFTIGGGGFRRWCVNICICVSENGQNWKDYSGCEMSPAGGRR